MDQKYLIGIPEIDAQHEEISGLIELLQEEASKKDQRRLIHQTLKRLYQLLTTHFEYEESLMTMVGYQDLPQHKKMHDGVLHLFNRHFDDPPSLDDFNYRIKAISEKVFAHVMEHDAPLTASIKERLASSPSPRRKET